MDQMVLPRYYPSMADFFDQVLTHPLATSVQGDTVRKFWAYARQTLGKKIKNPAMTFESGVWNLSWNLCGVGLLEMEFHDNGNFTWFFKDRVTKNYWSSDPEPMGEPAMKKVCEYLARDPEYSL